MSRKLENTDLGEVSEPAIIESLKCLDMNSKDLEENTEIDDNNLEEKGKVNQLIQNSSSSILFVILEIFLSFQLINTRTKCLNL